MPLEETFNQTSLMSNLLNSFGQIITLIVAGVVLILIVAIIYIIVRLALEL